MRTASPPEIRPLSIARLLRWAMLWLLKHALFLVSGEPDARVHLRRMTRTVARLIFLRAYALLPQRPRRRCWRPLSAPTGFVRRRCTSAGRMLRAAIGASLRRRLRGRGPAQRLCALLYALWRAEQLAARLARRLALGLTRLSPILALRPPADLLDLLAAPAPRAADSS